MDIKTCAAGTCKARMAWCMTDKAQGRFALAIWWPCARRARRESLKSGAGARYLTLPLDEPGLAC